MRNPFKKRGHMAVFLKKDGGRYTKIGQKPYDLTDAIVSFKDRTFTIIAGNTFIDNNKTYLFFDFDNSKIITFEKTDMGIDAELLDQIIVKKIIQQLVSSLRNAMEKPSKSVIMTYIIIGGLGACIGYIIAQQTMPKLVLGLMGII